MPTKGLSNNLVICAIDIKRDQSPDLQEKTNREGFIENDAYYDFKGSISYSLGIIQSLRYADKVRLREIYSSSKSREPVLQPIKELKALITKKIKIEKSRKEIFTLVDKVENEYLEMKKILITSSSSGLSLGIAIHEIEKIISELVIVVKKSKSGDRVDKLVLHLFNLIDNYSNIIRGSKSKKINITKQIENAMFNCEYRFEVHNVTVSLSQALKKFKKDIFAPSNLVISTLMNIFDNSIYWLHYGNVQNKKIFLDIQITKSDIALSVLDNGPGFTVAVEDAKRVFFTGKSNGMGMGLHLASEVMASIGGELILNDFDYIENIPKGFQKGALVTLIFKKK
jgi:signal transduction histidine kinase